MYISRLPSIPYRIAIGRSIAIPAVPVLFDKARKKAKKDKKKRKKENLL